MNLSGALSNLRNARVLVTGNTGFKGSWLSLWLREIGVNVSGFSDVAEAKSMYSICRLEELVPTAFGDIRNPASFFQAAESFRPDVIIHLAAQPIVRESLRDPLTTFGTNAMGTATVLEFARVSPLRPKVVLVTSDKVYQNHGWPWGYRETDALSQQDPYSTSKALSEMIARSYFETFSKSGLARRVAIGRAGNVIGGGDFASDRLIPDVFRSLRRDKKLLIRNPASTRPWQHVLEPLSGYLLLAALLLDEDPSLVGGEAFNFGPSSSEVATVSDVLARLQQFVQFSWESDQEMKADGSEARLLSLDCSKAAQLLDWYPTLSLDSTLEMTSDWYLAWLRSSDDAASLRQVALDQIGEFLSRQE